MRHATDFALWESEQPPAITGDSLWKLDAYRLAAYLLDRTHDDLRASRRDYDTARAREQLLAAVGSIGANIAEGYGRTSIADRARFTSYALGSVRESICWYRAIRSSLPAPVVAERYELLARLRQMLIRMLPAHRFTP